METLFCGGTEHGGGARKQNTSNQDGKAGCWVSFSAGSEDELVRAGGGKVASRGVQASRPAGEQAAVVFL